MGFAAPWLASAQFDCCHCHSSSSSTCLEGNPPLHVEAYDTHLRVVQEAVRPPLHFICSGDVDHAALRGQSQSIQVQVWLGFRIKLHADGSQIVYCTGDPALASRVHTQHIMHLRECQLRQLGECDWPWTSQARWHAPLWRRHLLLGFTCRWPGRRRRLRRLAADRGTNQTASAGHIGRPHPELQRNTRSGRGRLAAHRLRQPSRGRLVSCRNTPTV